MKKPVRRIRPNTRSLTGRLVDYASRTSQEHESLLERDALLVLSFDPAVESVAVQPVRIDYLHRDGLGRCRRRHYTPDLLVHYYPHLNRPPTYIEVKYERIARRQCLKLRPSLRAGYLYARQRGALFRVYTERRIRVGARLRNVKFLRPLLREGRQGPASAHLLATLRELGGRATVDAWLRQACASSPSPDWRPRLMSVLWRLLATREVQAALDAAPLTLGVEVWLEPTVPAAG